MLQSDDDELLGPAPPPRRRVLIAGAAVAVLVAAAVTALAVARHGHGDQNTHMGVPTQPVAPVTVPVPAATDALVIGGGVGYATDSHVVTYTADLLNQTRARLIVSGSVQAIGPDGAPVPGVTALLAPRGTDRRGRPVTAVRPGQHVTLALRTSFDCPPPPMSLPAGYPHIVIPLRGYPSPAEYPFSYFWGSTGRTDRFLAGLCGSP